MADTNTVSQSPALDETPFPRNGNLIKFYFFLLAPLVTSTSSGSDLSLTNRLQSVNIFINNFGNHSGATLGFYEVSVSVRALCALFFSSTIVGRLGQRAACFIGSIFVMACPSWSSSLQHSTSSSLASSSWGSARSYSRSWTNARD
jgi:hypothetical protein